MIQEKKMKVEINDAINSFIYILKFYKEKAITQPLDSLVKNFDFDNPFEAIEKIAMTYNILSVNCNNTNIQELKNCKYPSIINISSDPNKKHYVACYGYNSENGFLLIDVLDTPYYVKELVMQTLWQDQVCWAFIY